VALNPIEPAPGVRRFTVPLGFASPDHLHVHVLDTPEGELLVDTGAIGSEDGLRAGLHAVDARPQRVLITHGHVDHWGLAATLVDEVLAHPGVLPTLHWNDPHAPPPEYGPGAPDPAEMLEVFSEFSSLAVGVPEVKAISDGDRLGDWQVLTTPGHDAGHICLYRADDGVLLCGDLLLPGFTPNVQPAADRSDALADFLGSLERMSELDVRLVLPAHGAPYADHRGRARALAHHHAERLERLREALAQGSRDLGGLRDAAFGRAFQSEPDRLMAELETYAHLDHLRRRDEIGLDGTGRWVCRR
jgi:glyoxylase-like metal-dependent hydrolase (beta-lactamase superfamily II)